MLAFQIAIKQVSRMYRMIVEAIGQSDSLEQFKVSPINNPGKFVVLQTNRKLFHGKGLKNRKGQWKVLKGSIRTESSLKDTIRAIDEVLDWMDTNG